MKKNFYNEVQKDNRESGGYYPEKVEFILENIGSNRRVLDIGCNDGYFGEKLIEQKNIVYGVDIVEENLKKAQDRGLKVKNVDIEKSKLPYKKNYFDVVILGDVIEHVFDTDRLLRECNRVLKNGGILLLTTPNVASLGRRIMLLLGISPFLEYSLELSTNGLPSVGHIRYYTVKTLTGQLNYCGYNIEKIVGDGVNFIFFRSRKLGRLSPSLSTMLLVMAKKTKQYEN